MGKISPFLDLLFPILIVISVGKVDSFLDKEDKDKVLPKLVLILVFMKSLSVLRMVVNPYPKVNADSIILNKLLGARNKRPLNLIMLLN